MKQSFKTKKQTAEAIASAVRGLEWPDNYHVCKNEAMVIALAKEIEDHSDFVFDVETTGVNAWTDKLLCISFFVNGSGYLIPLEHRLIPSLIDPALVKKHLHKAFSDPNITRSNHNIKFDMHFLEEQLGLECGPIYCDTMVQSQIINPDTNVSHGLKELCAFYGISSDTGNYTAQFGKTAWSYIEPRLASLYAIKDCELVSKLMAAQDAVLADPDLHKLRSLFWDLEMPMLNLTYEMERKGINVDLIYMRDTLIPTVYTEWRKAIEALRPIIEPHLKFCGAATVEKALDSPTKLEKVYFDCLDVPLIKHITLKRHPYASALHLEDPFIKRSLDKEAIAGLSKENKAMRLLGEYRKWATVKKMFADALPDKIVDKHIHPVMNCIGAATGRMSFRDPNLQQIPSRMGPLVRNLFIPEPGNIFMSADFSGQEMRLLAHYSKDTKLRNFYLHPNGLDIYSQTAIDAFHDDAFKKSGTTKAKFAEMSKGKRKAINVYTDAKSLVLGLGYGLGPAKYARGTGKTLAEGKVDYAAYREAYPGIVKYQDAAKAYAKKNGYITTLLGRRRSLPFINSTSSSGEKASAERAAMNCPIQGSAADMVKKAALDVKALIDTNRLPIRLVLMIHDEIVFEMPAVWAKANPNWIKSITDTMCNALPLNVPMESSAVFESRWGTEMEIDDVDDLIADMAV